MVYLTQVVGAQWVRWISGSQTSGCCVVLGVLLTLGRHFCLLQLFLGVLFGSFSRPHTQSPESCLLCPQKSLASVPPFHLSMSWYLLLGLPGDLVQTRPGLLRKLCLFSTASGTECNLSVWVRTLTGLPSRIPLSLDHITYPMTSQIPRALGFCIRGRLHRVPLPEFFRPVAGY